jgi:hypothetical protein
MDDEMKLHRIKAWADTAPLIIQNPITSRELFRINADGSVVGEIEDASEAAKVFFESMRGFLPQPQTDALKMAREALEGMVRYSGMRESWQDDNPQYVTAAHHAIDVIDAALKESK